MVKFINSILFENPNTGKVYPGEFVDLVYRYEINEEQAYDGIPTIYYDVVLHDTKTRVGSIDLRLKMNDEMYYYGHIGYNILPHFRGNHYSYYACKILFQIAKEERGMEELIVTCSPENIASYKTLKKLKGKLTEVVQVPPDHELYKKGETMKCIFRYKIKI